MMRRFSGLRQRYLNHALRLTDRPRPICDAAGRQIGAVSDIVWRAQRLTVTGQAGPGSVGLRTGAVEVSQFLPSAQSEFRLEMPLPTGELLAGCVPVVIPPEGSELEVRLRHIRALRILLTLQLLWRLVELAPSILRWFTRRDPDSKARIKARLGLNLDQTPAGPVPANLFATAPTSAGPGDTTVTIVLPVYNAAALTEICLDRIARNTDLPWRIIIVEDCSTDSGLRPMLRAWAAARPEGQVRLIEHDSNQGFLASVNDAFAALLSDPEWRNSPVVLLNTDALVPPGWASRLVAPLLDDPSVASVTPMSNDAEIFSVPAICARSDLCPGQAETIDRTAARLHPAVAAAPAPTGVGFCMALAPGFLGQVPRFDTVFGRGYGEEVDWCQKVRGLGGRHLGLATLFVEHRGGASFGSAEKATRIARSGEILTRRYPKYDAEVQDFLTVDPLRAPRLALAVAWAASARPGVAVPVYLAHALGGGAEHWLRARIGRDAAAGLPSVVLRVGGPMRWQVEVWAQGGTTAGWTEDLAMVEALLDPVQHRRIVYSCGVGDRDPFSLPEVLLRLKRSSTDRIEALFHDYFALAPAMNLLDGAGRYHGPVTPELLETLPAAARASYSIRRPDGRTVDLGAWQRQWHRLLAQAADIQVFSASSARIVAAVWPEFAERIALMPHALSTEFPPCTPPAGGPRVLGVLGNIAPHKGAALVQALAEMPQTRRGGPMVLIGDIDPAFALPRGCPVHGRYDPADIPALVRHYGITHWLVPSLCPETFSFTTHEALQTGLPVLAFDIGAQGDAVDAAPNGVALRYAAQATTADLAERVCKAFQT